MHLSVALINAVLLSFVADDENPLKFRSPSEFENSVRFMTLWLENFFHMDFGDAMHKRLLSHIRFMSEKSRNSIKLSMLRGSRLKGEYPLYGIHIKWVRRGSMPLRISPSNTIVSLAEEDGKIARSPSFNSTDTPILMMDNADIVNYLTYHEMGIVKKIFPTELLSDIKWQSGLLSPNITKLVKNFNQVRASDLDHR